MEGESYFGKKGQVTLYVIIAIIIFAVGLLLFLFYPHSQTSSSSGSSNPYSFVQTCLKEGFVNQVRLMSLQGGEINPKFYYTYNGSKIKYLCYTNSPYTLCTVQQSLLKEHMISELENSLKGNVSSCFNKMKESYEKQGYKVNMTSGTLVVGIMPKQIIFNFKGYTFAINKGTAKKFKNFSVRLDSHLNQLLAIEENILEWEATYGDADVNSYMAFYHNLQVEKKKQEDGTTIYILKEINTGEVFQFASRSNYFGAGIQVKK